MISILTIWKIVDLIFGEEKSTPFFNDTSVIDFKIYTPEFMKRIKEFTARWCRNIYVRMLMWDLI